MSNSDLNLRARHLSFGGETAFYTHFSTSCQSSMRFAVYTPPAAKEKRLPVMYWLSGLTCTEENFMTKAGAQRYAAEHEVIIVAPDTSPRGLNLPEENDDWDFGSGAGFYVNATQEPWSKHYNMYDYIVEELPDIINRNFNTLPGRTSIFGHSMGGHGALVIALRNPGKYRCVSAYAPICAPSLVPWGQKAFLGYLGEDRSTWAAYDTCALLEKLEKAPPLYIDQGTDDQFLAEQLGLDHLKAICEKKGFDLHLREHEGYDHSYFTIATFIADHIRVHAAALHSDN